MTGLRKAWVRVYRGVVSAKPSSDLWNFMELMYERKVRWVIECGTKFGGSAYLYADQLLLAGSSGLVVTVDIEDNMDSRVKAHPYVSFVLGDSTALETLREVRERVPPPGERDGALLVILDSDHSYEHVMAELEAYVPMLAPGDPLIVEDTIHPSFKKGGLKAVKEFCKREPRLVWDSYREGMCYGNTCCSMGYYVWDPDNAPNPQVTIGLKDRDKRARHEEMMRDPVKRKRYLDVCQDPSVEKENI